MRNDLYFSLSSLDIPYRTRTADLSDSSVLSVIERDAFPTQWPPTRFSREIGRQRVTYLAATREYLPHERPAGPRNRRPRQFEGPLAGLMNLIQRCLALGQSDSGYPRDFVAGFVGIWCIADEAHIISIGVRESEKRRGIGELLLLAAFNEARNKGCNELTLEVRASNEAAQALYRKYGFTPVGLRKKYYIDNGEDAIIMTTPPISGVEYAQLLNSLARNHAERWGRMPEPI